jgi:RNA polymerase sigma-70 factor, ECF subfamily
MLRPRMTDDDLIDQVRAGDEQAFGTLVDRYHPRLVGLAQSIVGSRPLAEEAAQETWIAVLRGVDGFEGRSAAKTWLFRICVNRARSIGKQEGRATPVDTNEPAVDPSRFSSTGHWSEPPEDWTAAADERLVAAQVAVQAHEAIVDLPDQQRQVVTLRDVEGLSSSEVCEVLSISAVNERVLLHRGRSRVRARLEQSLKGRLS